MYDVGVAGPTLFCWVAETVGVSAARVEGDAACGLLFRRLLPCQTDPLLLLCRKLSAVTIEVECGFLEVLQLLRTWACSTMDVELQYRFAEQIVGAFFLA